MPTIGHAHKLHVKGSVLLNLQKGALWLAVKTKHVDTVVQHCHIISPNTKDEKQMMRKRLICG